MKKYFLKRWKLGILIGILTLCPSMIWALPLDITHNNDRAYFYEEPIIKENTVFLPVKEVTRLVGLKYNWNPKTKLIEIHNGSTIYSFKAGSKVIYKQLGGSKEALTLSVAPIVWEGTSFLPLEGISKIVDVRISLDAKNENLSLSEPIYYRDKQLFFNATIEEIESLLGKPHLKMNDGIHDVAIYNEDYRELLILYYKDNKMVGFYTTAESFRMQDFAFRRPTAEDVEGLRYIFDLHNNNKLVAVGDRGITEAPMKKERVLVEEQVIFELTNAFRAQHGVSPLKQNENIGRIARAHSQDMADQNFFNHQNLKGESPGDRIELGGVKYRSYGENIAAGNSEGFSSFKQWVHSEGHRNNMLKQHKELGVGTAYNPSSDYTYYNTQLFFTGVPRN